MNIIERAKREKDYINSKRKVCAVCGKKFIARRVTDPVCSNPKCKLERKRLWTIEYKKKKGIMPKGKAKKKKVTVIYKRKCSECKEPFTTNMPKVLTCGPKCSRERKDRKWEQKKLNSEKKTEDRTIIYHGYKEPFIPLKKEFFGYEGVILEDKDTSEIQCHICGRWFKSLASHLQVHMDFLENKNIHPITDKNKYAASYKDFFGLKRGTALCSSATRERIIEGQQGHPYWERRVKSRIEWQKEQAKVNKKGKGINNLNVAEKKNERGICFVQILDIIRKKAIELGRSPQVREIKGYDGQDLSHTINRTYGSHNEALKLLKLTANIAGKVKSSALSSEFLIDCLINFQKRYDRIPGNSDFRNEILPSKEIFKIIFGSLDNALAMVEESKYPTLKK